MGWLEALISGAFGIADTTLKNRMPLSVSDRQAHQLNVDETMRQEQRQEDFYNQYQSIGAQVRQMQDAGINPAVAAGGLQAPSPASGPSYSGASASPASGLDSVIPMLQALNVIKMEKAENKRKQEAHEVGVRKTEAEIRNLDARSSAQEFQNLHQEELFEMDKDEREARVSQIFASIDKAEADTALARANTNLKELEAQYQEYSNALADLEVQYREPILRAQLAKTEAETKYIQYQQELNDARLMLDIAKSEDERKLIEARVSLLEKQTSIASEEARVAGELQDYALEHAKGSARYERNKTALGYINEVTKGVATISGALFGVAKGLSNPRANVSARKISSRVSSAHRYNSSHD